MASIKFTSTKLTNSNKKGILTPDSEGYYEMVIGGLNTFNSANEYYLLNGAEELFKDSSVFMRRVKNGCLKGECGHPKRPEGMRDDAFMNRIFTIDERNVCCHFKEVWLDTNYGKNNPQLNNPNLVAIMAKIKPAGPMGPSLQASLDNPNENVCFSIRALTRDFYERGQTFRVLQQIVCFDHVVEPGISIANKWDSPGLEALQDIIINKKLIENILVSKQLVATESSKELATECLNIINQNNFSIAKLPLISKW